MWKGLSKVRPFSCWEIRFKPVKPAREEWLLITKALTVSFYLLPLIHCNDRQPLATSKFFLKYGLNTSRCRSNLFLSQLKPMFEQVENQCDLFISHDILHSPVKLVSLCYIIAVETGLQRLGSYLVRSCIRVKADALFLFFPLLSSQV